MAIIMYLWCPYRGGGDIVFKARGACSAGGRRYGTSYHIICNKPCTQSGTSTEVILSPESNLTTH